jgi:CMP-N,N'-diacetyllegionaminic acid synthase
MVVGYPRECSMIYALIGARAGSKSIPDKNIKSLAGKPLIAYSIAVAKQVSEIDRIIVSTDSEKYAQISKTYGAEILYLQPDSISGPSNCDIDWIGFFITWLQKNEKLLPEYIVHLRPTSPLRDFQYIQKAIYEIKQHPKATALRSVVEMSQSAYKCFEITDGYLKPIGSSSFNLDVANKPRQYYPKTYDANGYVDILRVSNILEHKQVHGNRVIPFLVPYIIDIDEERDFEYAKYEVQKNPEIVNSIFGKHND